MKNWITLFLASVLPMIASAYGQDGPKYKSIDELPKGDRETFKACYAAFKDATARQEELERRIEKEMPLYARAKRRNSELSQLQDPLAHEGESYHRFYRNQSPEAYRQFTTWPGLHRVAVEFLLAQELFTETATRPYVEEYAKGAFDAALDGQYHPDDWSLAQPLLPKTRDGLTAAVAGKFWVLWYVQRVERIKPNLEKLEHLLKVSVAAKDWATRWCRAEAEIRYHAFYIESHGPEEWKAIDKEIARNVVKMGRVWWGWAEALHEGEFRLPPEQPKSPADQQTDAVQQWVKDEEQQASLQRQRRSARWPALLVINTIVILVAAVNIHISRIRARRQQAA